VIRFSDLIIPHLLHAWHVVCMFIRHLTYYCQPACRVITWSCAWCNWHIGTNEIISCEEILYGFRWNRHKGIWTDEKVVYFREQCLIIKDSVEDYWRQLFSREQWKKLLCDTLFVKYLQTVMKICRNIFFMFTYNCPVDTVLCYCSLFCVAVKMWSCVSLPLLSPCANEKMGWPKDNICIFSVPNM